MPESELKSMGRMYTCMEVARLLSVNVLTIYNWIKQGKIKAIRIGSGPKSIKRISERSLEDYLNIGKNEPETKVITKEAFFNPPIPSLEEMERLNREHNGLFKPTL